MTLDRDLRIRTAEHVGISYDVAGIGNRVLAAFLDVLFILVIVLGLSFIVIRAILPQLRLSQSTDFTIAAVLIVVLYLLTPFAYWVVLETFWNGQTLGKRIVGIRVLRDDGSPVGFFAIAARALLRILDLVPILLPVDIVLMVGSRKGQRLGDFVASTVVTTGPNGGNVVVQQGPSTLLSLLYYVFFWSTYGGGQTLGMRVLKLKVVKTDGTMLDLVGAFIRYVGFVISAIALGIGFIWAAFDANKQGWHDKIAGTYVVRTG